METGTIGLIVCIGAAVIAAIVMIIVGEPSTCELEKSEEDDRSEC